MTAHIRSIVVMRRRESSRGVRVRTVGGVMKVGRRFTSSVAVTVLALAGPALADYDSHPGLRPENRCVTKDGRSFAEAGIDPVNCQRLIYDLPATVKVGTIAV